jgi:hypothetical protein
MRHFLAVALVLFTASVAFAQSPSTPATQVDEIAAAVPNPGGWCEGKSDDGRGSNFGRCFGSVAKTQTGSVPESGSGDSGN